MKTWITMSLIVLVVVSTGGTVFYMAVTKKCRPAVPFRYCPDRRHKLVVEDSVAMCRCEAD